MNLEPKMRRFKNLDRRMIPFAVLARVPGTIDEFEGIDIEPASLRDVRFDAANLAQDLSSNNNDGQIYKLLSDFENLINASKHDTLGVGQNIIKYTEQRINILRDHASALYKEILALMLTREKSSRNPKAKLTNISTLSNSNVKLPLLSEYYCLHPF